MTWASQTVAKSFTRAGAYLRRRLWLWPIIGVTLLALVGALVHGAIESTMKSNLASQLTTLRDVEVAMLKTWLEAQENNVESMANDSEIRRLVASLLDDAPPRAANGGGEPVDPAALRRELAQRLSPEMSPHDYTGFVLIDRQHVVVAATSDEFVGHDVTVPYDEWVSQTLDGESTVTRPFPSISMLKDESGDRRSNVPTMFAFAPVRDGNFQVAAALGVRIRPEREFTRILQLGRIGESGETYAFDSEGMMLSNSRFDESLKLLGLLQQTPASKSLLTLLVRDPGGDMTRGHRPDKLRAALPLTLMAADASAGNSGVDVEGYRDYRGAPVVGAWTWLPKYRFGVATESDLDEAFRPLTILKRTFWGLMTLLGLTSVAILVFSVVVSRLQRQAREAAIEARQLGQYKLDEKIGAGAMGVVYRGRHAMLRRPTAIKLLDADKVTETAIGRFEREVQITSQLNHPNTIAIYDYGRTPEGVFYYAMEYLDGIDLQSLVNQHGPQPAGRVIHILRQVCGSLYEAHTMGLVHRDIKPANIMLNRRGAESDVVKVLDFGLVKSLDDVQAEDRHMAGTPLYLSPEAIQMPSSVDACSDIYAVGAVGYFLLTGQPVFDAENLSTLCQKHISEAPRPPSERVREATVPEDLETVILSCLEKTRARRPQTARELARQLANCADAAAWSMDDAERWWGRAQRGYLGPISAPGRHDDGPSTQGNDHDETMAL
ncbi:MAG: serine/threonine protein kinase [Planctomycetales bacterium]|nr:serine/threonine protein kinase [Planctomycetales bacterium]